MDLSVSSDTLFEELYAALLAHLVIFLPDQSLTTGEHRDFAVRFGVLDRPAFEPPFKMPPIEGHPEIYQLIKEAADGSANLGGFWHADMTHREKPNLAAISYVREAPSVGGDTLFSNLYLAYETLSPGLQNMLSRMQAVHSSAMPYGGASARSAAISRSHVPGVRELEFEVTQIEGEPVETTHPVVRRHPDTGRKLLYVNRGFTSHILGWTMEESLPLLGFLWKHAERPEFTCRYRWSPRTVGIWDNRCVLHYALNDYYGERRVLHRIAVNEASRPSA